MLGRGPVAVGLLLWSRSRQRRKHCFGVVERRRHAGGRVVRDRLGVGLGESDRVRVRGVRPRRLVLVLVVIGFVLAVLILLGRARVGRVDRLDSGLANLLQQLVGAFHDLRRLGARDGRRTVLGGRAYESSGRADDQHGGDRGGLGLQQEREEFCEHGSLLPCALLERASFWGVTRKAIHSSRVATNACSVAVFGHRGRRPGAFCVPRDLAMGSQRRYTRRTPSSRSARHGDRGYPRDVAFRSRDGLLLRGWWFGVAGADRAVVMVHGRARNRVNSSFHPADIARMLLRHRYSVLLFDLRAHGESEGTRYTLGIEEPRDILAAIDLAATKANLARTRVALIGESLGGGSALMTVQADPSIGPVITDSAFADGNAVVSESATMYTNLPAIFTPGIVLTAGVFLGLDV